MILLNCAKKTIPHSLNLLVIFMLNEMLTPIHTPRYYQNNEQNKLAKPVRSNTEVDVNVNRQPHIKHYFTSPHIRIIV